MGPDDSGGGHAKFRLADEQILTAALPDELIALDVEPDGGLAAVDEAEFPQLLEPLFGAANEGLLMGAVRRTVESGEPSTAQFDAVLTEGAPPVTIEFTAISLFGDGLAHCERVLVWARRLFEDSDRDASADGLELSGLAADLARALNRDEFELNYQPIHELRTGRLVGVEALVRWQHPERGVIAPDDFIPLAEATGLMVDLGEWVLHEACGNAADWNRNGPHRLGVSVNLSSTELHSGSVFRMTRAALASSGLDPALLTVELSESDLIGDRHGIYAALGHLRAIGVNVAIDDFGVGYSNLVRLRQLRGRIIKIDGTLVAGIGTDEQLREMLTAVVAMVKSLDCVVIAEGVESQAELDFLRLLGIDYSQGFHHARPMTGADFTNYFETSVERPLH